MVEALAGAEAALPDPANGIAISQPGPPTVYGAAEPDREQLVDAARGHIDRMARDYPAIVTRIAYHQFNRTRRTFANSHGVVRQETRGRYSFFTLFAARRNGHATSFNYHGVSSYVPFAQLAEVGALPQLYGDMVRSFDPQPSPSIPITRLRLLSSITASDSASAESKIATTCLMFVSGRNSD